MSSSSSWFVYMVCCCDSSLYTGVTTDLKRRVEEHNDSARGARYTRSRRPVRLVYSEGPLSRSAACRREANIKALCRSAKLALISAASNSF